jgi:hypothetical protein
MRIPALDSGQLRELARFGVGLEGSTPLWYYILKEAELAGGATLTGVGARIVGKVFPGLLALNPNSYLARDPKWRPRLPSRTPGTFTMVDLLTYAGVDPGQPPSAGLGSEQKKGASYDGSRPFSQRRTPNREFLRREHRKQGTGFAAMGLWCYSFAIRH